MGEQLATKSIISLLPSKVEHDVLGLTINTPLTFQEERELWAQILYLEAGSKWWLGDLYNASSTEMQSLIETLSEGRFVASRLKKIARVCSKIPRSNRRPPPMTFEHHEVVYALAADEITTWLNKAEKGEDGNPWSVRQLRAALGRAPHPGPPSAEILKQVGLYKGDFRSFDFHNIDAIITDPPYDGESVTLFGDVAKKSLDWLRPGGLLIAYSGQFYLPDVYAQLGQHLEYVWTFSIRHSGGNQPIMPRRLYCTWKPVLIFGKPPIEYWWDYFQDSVSGGREKELHAWQQAEAESAYFIDHLSQKGGLILDPMCGSGTVLAAAKMLGRKYIGIDIDPFALRQAEERLHNE